jgi:polyhydroxyalkanoate synthesis regulator phasin
MNANNLFQVVQQGFRITVGATASLLETIQDPQKRAETISELQTELSQKTREWAQKGEITEQEARRMLDNLFRQRGWQTNSEATRTSSETESTPYSTSENVESNLQELTEQIIALRTELEQLRKSENTQ